MIPEIEKEVNVGKNFAALRQVYNSMILAVWYKQALKESLLGKVYVDQNKVKGVDLDDPQVKQKIYDQYLASFKKGVYNYIKEEYDSRTQEIIPKKYFSGGFGALKYVRTWISKLNHETTPPEMLTAGDTVEKYKPDKGKYTERYNQQQIGQ